jgi:Glycosyl transferases group 1
VKIGIASTDIGIETEGDVTFTYPGGSFWYRYSQPITMLGLKDSTVVGQLTYNRQGILGIETYDTGETHFDCDVILLQRCMWQNLPEAIMLARSQGQVVINDIDDWFDGLPPTNQAFKSTAKANDPGVNREIYTQVLAASSALICSTPFLVERYARLRRPIHLWRNSIDFDSFPTQRVHQDKPTIGWLGNLNFRARDVEELRGIISPLLDEHDLTFHHVGHVDTPGTVPLVERIGVKPERMMLTGSVSFIMLGVDMASYFDIGVAPLEDIRFNDAKSCLKGMEYVAAGIPFVASPSAEYRWLHSHGIGRLARRPLEWKKRLTELLDPVVRGEEAERNLKLMRPLVDAKITAPLWLDIVEDTAP